MSVIRRSHRRDLRRNERGQAIVEMALALPLLVGLILGVIEIGRYADLAIVVADAARTGAVYGAQNLAAAGDQDGNIELAAQTDANLSPPTDLHVTPAVGLLPSGGNLVTPCTAVSDTGNPLPYVIVRTQYTTQFLFSSSQFTVRGCAQMQVAQ